CDDGSRRGVLGRNHLDDQGKPAHPSFGRKSHAVSARRVRTAHGDCRDPPWRTRCARAVDGGHWSDGLSNRLGRALIARYSASRLSAFTFLTPLFGVAAGHLVLGDPLTPAFAAAVTLVAAGLVLVNRAQECIQKGGLSPAIILLYLSRRRLVLKAA